MSVLFFGDPAGALALIERGVQLVGLVHGRPGGRGRRALSPHLVGLPRWRLPDLSSPSVVAALADTAPRLIVSYFYPRMIPQSVLNLAPGINVHPSDLPRWRGPDPCTWAIRSGDAQTAICVHQLTEGIDEGDVLHRLVVPIMPRDNTGRLAKRVENLGADLVADVAEQILAGKAPTARPQTGSVTWAPTLDPDDWEIDWHQPAKVVDAWVRAASPEPGAYTGIGRELLVILDGRPVDAEQFERLEPATPFVRAGRAYIRCGLGAYRVDRVRLGRRFLTGRQFAALLV
ncbi:MAG: formyltransferase family protein [Myxococcota bacterium]|nr:formyltransferase family protein [Myxococcota bacterium]